MSIQLSYMWTMKRLKKSIQITLIYLQKPTEEEKNFGECTLTIKVATRNLNEEERGISIFAKGIYKAKINNPHGEKVNLFLESVLAIN